MRWWARYPIRPPSSRARSRRTHRLSTLYPSSPSLISSGDLIIESGEFPIVIKEFRMLRVTRVYWDEPLSWISHPSGKIKRRLQDIIDLSTVGTKSSRRKLEQCDSWVTTSLGTDVLWKSSLRRIWSFDPEVCRKIFGYSVFVCTWKSFGLPAPRHHRPHPSWKSY